MTRNICSRFPSNSEPFASESLQNLEQMFPIGTAVLLIYLTGLNLKPHSGVLPVVKGSTNNTFKVKKFGKYRRKISSRLVKKAIHEQTTA